MKTIRPKTGGPFWVRVIIPCMIALVSFFLAGCDCETYESAQAHNVAAMNNPLLVSAFNADPATMVAKDESSCGTVKTTVTFKKKGVADDGKTHIAEFNGKELKYIDGVFYEPAPADAKSEPAAKVAAN